jgi:hypothetical protein
MAYCRRLGISCTDTACSQITLRHFSFLSFSGTYNADYRIAFNLRQYSAADFAALARCADAA